MLVRTVVLIMLAGLTGAARADGERPGKTGEVGKPIGIGTAPPWLFTLKSAEYSLGRRHVAKLTFSPSAEDKMLVLRFTAQNASNADQAFGGESLFFTAVDAENLNYQNLPNIANERDSAEVDVVLKPKQKLEAFTVIFVPAQSLVPKLMVATNETDPILRYDLRGKVTLLKPPFVAEDDKTGAKVLDPIPGKPGEWCPACLFDLRLDSFGKIEVKDDEWQLGDGEAWYAVCLSVHNSAQENSALGIAALVGELLLDDGTQAEGTSQLHTATSTRVFESELKPDAEVKVRLIYRLPQDAVVKSLSLRSTNGSTDNRDSHTFLFRLAPAP